MLHHNGCTEPPNLTWDILVIPSVWYPDMCVTEMTYLQILFHYLTWQQALMSRWRELPTMYLVVTCDLKKLSNVEDATAVIKPETGELMLPGNFSVTYACNEWYSLISSSDKVRCEYNMQPREWSPADDYDAKLVTAVWRGQEGIWCEKGIRKAIHFLIIVMAIVHIGQPMCIC